MVTTISHLAGGINFKFSAHSCEGTIPNMAGLYLLTRYNFSTQRYDVLYVGQSKTLLDRLSSHEQWPAAVRLGMTHVLITFVPSQADRDKLERILIQDLTPQLNTQLMPKRGLFG